MKEPGTFVPPQIGFAGLARFTGLAVLVDYHHVAYGGHGMHGRRGRRGAAAVWAESGVWRREGILMGRGGWTKVGIWEWSNGVRNYEYACCTHVNYMSYVLN